MDCTSITIRLSRMNIMYTLDTCIRRCTQLILFEGLSSRMVPFRVCDHWRPLSRALCLPTLHCYDIGSVLQPNSFDAWKIDFKKPGPRFALVFLWYVLTARPDSVLPQVVVGTGVFRTLTCGGWTYVTSTDDHGWHDIFMISYLVATLPWTLGCIALSPKGNPKALKYRKILAGSFFGTLVPLIYFFIQHKVHKVAGGKGTRIFYS